MKLIVIIPAFKCRAQILSVIARIPASISQVIVVDDACPQHTGEYVTSENRDPRVKVIRHEVNQGVGGAMVTGYGEALRLGGEIMIKIDGDDQMDPALIPKFILPILSGRADYTKGNRFFFLDGLRQMPKMRLFGNAALSFLNKLVTGYWNIMDPTNGYCAIHAQVLRYIPLEKLSKRYFFESDMMFRLGTMRAVIVDVPMHAKYGDEVSNLKISTVLASFPKKYLLRFFKRSL